MLTCRDSTACDRDLNFPTPNLPTSIPIPGHLRGDKFWRTIHPCSSACADRSQFVRAANRRLSRRSKFIRVIRAIRGLTPLRWFRECSTSDIPAAIGAIELRHRISPDRHFLGLEFDVFV